MSDVVVTVPMWFWPEWIAEGDCAGDELTGRRYDFSFGGNPPTIEPGERVYVVAHGKLRGYAPLVELATYDGVPNARSRRVTKAFTLVRAGGAVAVTVAAVIRGFQGFRYRWWEREAERPFPEWRTP